MEFTTNAISYLKANREKGRIQTHRTYYNRDFSLLFTYNFIYI